MSAIDVIADQPWAITEPWLRTILEIAARDHPGPELVEALRGEPLDNTRTVTMRDGVARIPISGPIFRHANLFTRISGATSTATIATDLRAALDSPEVNAIVLDIDSPGGEAKGIGELAGMVRSVRGIKPIVAYVGGAGQSAAYWVASAADRVVVSSTAVVGSIGALVQVDRRPDGDKAPLVIVSSQSPEKYHDPETAKGQTKIQAMIDSLAQVFVEEVAANRGVSPEHALAHFGRGGSFVGRDAVAAGLADSLGSLEGLINELATSNEGIAMKDRPNPKTDPAKGKIQMSDNVIEMSDEQIAELDAPLQTIVRHAQAQAIEAKKANDRVVALQAQMVDRDAEQFAASLISGKEARATPSERQALIRQYKAAARLDEIDGNKAEVNFSDGAKEVKGTHLDAFKAEAKLRPIVLTKGERVADTSVELSAEPTEEDAKKAAADRQKRKELNHKLAQ